MNKGVITIKDLELEVYVGVHEEEIDSLQKVLLTVEIHTDISEAVESDDISKALDYLPLIDDVKRYIKENRHRLIERYAYNLGGIFLNHPRAKKVVLEFKKPNILSDVDYISVRIERSGKTRKNNA